MGPFQGFIFSDENRRNERESLDPPTKEYIESHLKECAEEMETKIFLEILCNVLQDLFIRVKKPEGEENGKKLA